MNRMRHPTEAQIQAAVLQWLRYEYPQVLAFSIPNEGRRSYAHAAGLKRMGLTAGVPDLFIAQPNTAHAGLWIEFKRGNIGRVTAAQASMHECLRTRGYCVSIVRTVQEGIDTISDYMRES